MATPSDKTPGKLPTVVGLWPPSAHRVRGMAAVILAICPAVVFAFLATKSGRWDLFERSGSIITAIGLLVASRRYVQFGILELAMLQAGNHGKPNTAEVLDDILTAKLGLALSAFGTVIWGWGEYLGWWSFGCLAIWALFAIRDTRRDLNTAGRDGLR